MHHNWDRDWDTGHWLPMALMMALLLGGLIWLAITVARRPPNVPPQDGRPSPPPARPTATDILAERLARGEIEIDDYRQRLAALSEQPPG